MYNFLAQDEKFFLNGLFEYEFPLISFYLFIFYDLLEKHMPLFYTHLRQDLNIPDFA